MNDFTYTILDIYFKFASELIQNYVDINDNAEIVIMSKYELDSDLYKKIKDNLKNITFWINKTFDLKESYAEGQLIKVIKRIEFDKEQL